MIEKTEPIEIGTMQCNTVEADGIKIGKLNAPASTNLYTTHTPDALDLELLYHETPVPEETQVLVNESLNSFHEMLEKRDNNKDSNWRLAEDQCPSECRDEFKFMFLRRERFEVKRAVKRYVRYWDDRVKIFGYERAFLPILDLGPNGAMGDNLEEVKCGYTRMAPPGKCQDRDGRAIFFIDGPSLDAAMSDPNVTKQGMARATWYCAHVLLRSEAAQRRGMVVMYKPIASLLTLKKSPAKAIFASMDKTFPLRCAAVHITDPPVLLSLLLKIAGGILTTRVEKRIFVHDLGSCEKNLKSLSRFGIDKRQLPTEFGGDFVFQEVVEFDRQSFTI